MLDLHCCVQAFSSYSERGLLPVAVHRVLLLRSTSSSTRASVVVACGLSTCGVGAELTHGTKDLLGPEIKALSPALAGRFLPTGPPGNSQV